MYTCRSRRQAANPAKPTTAALAAKLPLSRALGFWPFILGIDMTERNQLRLSP